MTTDLTPLLEAALLEYEQSTNTTSSPNDALLGMEENNEDRTLEITQLLARVEVQSILYASALRSADDWTTGVLRLMTRDMDEKAKLSSSVSISENVQKQVSQLRWIHESHDSSAIVNAFFDSYPECQKSQHEKKEAENDFFSSSESEEGDENEASNVVAKKKPKHPATIDMTTPPSQQQQPVNPYGKATAPSHSQHQQSWHDPEQQQQLSFNPFRSAREVVPQQQEQQQNNNINYQQNINNPYQQGPVSPLPPEQLPIRESLKRKFQPPTKRNSSNSEVRAEKIDNA